MTSFERRQQILKLIQKRPGIKVTELAKRLSVSEGTIRNDLNAMQRDGQITRVRGGAVPLGERSILNAAFAERAQQNPEAKMWIARRAAEMIEDGDSIIMDASSSVFSMVPHLKNRQNLTIITNGIELGLALAKNASHTVILLGGFLRADGTSVVGHLGEKILDELHVKTAFVSCSGFSLEAGLTEVDIQEVQIKEKMMHCADSVVALVDSSKFGKVDLTSFAGLDQISHIFSDKNLPSQYIKAIRNSNTALTICGETTALSYTPYSQTNGHYKIGFANLGETMPFAVDVRRGIEYAAKKAGNIDLVVTDNQLNGEVALKVADRLIAEEVDLAIEFQIDEKIGNQIIDKFNQANIPVIAVDIPMLGATFFGVDNYRAGKLAGVALGEWVSKHWRGECDRLIVLEEPKAGALPAARIQGQLDGLETVVGKINAAKIIHLDCGNTSEVSRMAILQTLKSLPHARKLAIISFNDDAAWGAVQATRQLGREKDVAIVGQGADRLLRKELRRPDTPVIGSTAYWPEKYGEQVIPVALKILKGQVVPPAVYNQHIFINKQNINQYYPNP